MRGFDRARAPGNGRANEHRLTVTPRTQLLPFVLLLASALLGGCVAPRAASPHARLPGELWVDLVEGEEAAAGDVIDDLAQAGVIYVGEYHTIPRHHEIQLALLQELFARQLPLVLCLEQLEARDQPALDRYGRREIDFAGLVQAVDWPSKWRNYPAYRALCEFARQHRIPIRALNAPTDLIRAVNRGGGVAKLTPEQRAQLPADLTLDDPDYERLTTLELAAHMGMDAARLRPMFEAQVARDEVMAENIVAARRADPAAPRVAFVVLGAGHMRYGLGTAARVRRREPAIVERLVLMSESGQLQLSEMEKQAASQARVTHDDLRRLGRPPADYLRLLPRASVTLPPGHPPVP